MGVNGIKIVVKGGNSMIVAICDDDSLFRRKLRDFLVEYKTSRRIHMDIVEFSDGEELLSHEYPYDIVFLDYDMPIFDGMETARILRARQNLCCIIFITAFPEHVFEAFEVSTYRYLLKPLDLPRLEQVVDRYIREQKLLAPIVLNIDGEQLTVHSKDIVYLEANGKYCHLRTTSEFLHCSKTLSRVLAMLPEHCFYRTHKSYAVNLHCISCIKDDIAVLTNGERVKISRNRLTNFKRAYKEFIKHFVLH